METLKRKRQASEVDLQGEETDSSLSPKTKKSPSSQVLENSRDIVVILDAGAQYGKVGLETKEEDFCQPSRKFCIYETNYHNYM